MKVLPNIIPGPEGSGFQLRLARASDIEMLRLWKNQHKRYFFLKHDITPEQQAAWFASYQERPHDHVFMVEEEGAEGSVAVGVVAARLLPDEGTVDLYNIMRGARTQADRTNMGTALLSLCSAIAKAYKESITCKVLADNPALGWYARLGLCEVEDRGSYKLLRLTRGMTE
jgi:ribosomal protein S18 acetylase RimI-like enzyme